MFDRAYRQRLDADLARLEAKGVITPATLAAIRGALPPPAPGINIPVVVGIVGGLLIAAAFLAFVAAHWIELSRLFRVALLVAGIIVAHGLGAWFARDGRTVLADLCASVGAIIFGAGIALVGQMYHLGDDFAGGMLLWAVGALAAAALTGSRGALAVALAAGCIWSVMRVLDLDGDLHLPFLALWLVAALLTIGWHSRVAAHLVAVAAIPWWIASALELGRFGPVSSVLAAGAALLLGGGIALAATPWLRAQGLGGVLSCYGAFALAGVAILEAMVFRTDLHAWAARQPLLAIACGLAGLLCAFTAAATAHRAGAALVGVAIGLALLPATTWMPRPGNGPWLAYAVELCAMLALVVSGLLDGIQARMVAGWLGIAGVIAAITWTVPGSLLHRSIFLAVAGAAAIVLEMLLHRLLPKADT